MKPIHIIFIIQLPKIAGGCQHFVGFQGGKWQAAHIDELLESSEQFPQIEQLINRSVSDLFQPENLANSDDIEGDESSESRVEMLEVGYVQRKSTSLANYFFVKSCSAPIESE